ncbi:MAG: type II secretion system F family protein [Bacillota bacterium]
MKTNRLSNTELSSFFDNMAVMLKAGITTEEAVNLLIEDNGGEPSPTLNALNAIAEAMSVGTAFGEAVANSGVFPDYAVSMIGAAEYTGNLEETLYHLGEYYRADEKTTKTLRAAIRYPISLLGMIIALLAIMLAMVFPAFREVYDNLSGSLAASSFRYVNGAFVACEVLLAVMIVLVAALSVGLLLWKRGRRDGIRAFLGRFKIFANIFEGFDLYRFTSCFNMFIASGELQDEAVKKSAAITETKALREKLGRCVSRMDEGSSFSQAAYGESLYDSISNRLLIPAERGGSLDAVLAKVAEGIRVENEENVNRVANTIEPVLTGLLLISVGLMLISLMIPLIGIMNSIG